MKKLLFVAVIAVFSLASCKKDHTCTCDHNGTKHTYQFPKTSSKDAKASCDALAAGGSACTLD
ncbi:MAG: hypothetical protein ACK4ND_02210 [Cytophagaceae bacterium]